MNNKNLLVCILMASLFIGGAGLTNSITSRKEISELKEELSLYKEEKSTKIRSINTEIVQFDTDMTSIQGDVQNLRNDLDSALSLVNELGDILGGGTNFK